MSAEQDRWTEYLTWYVSTYNQLTPEQALWYGDTLEAQARALFEHHMLQEANSLLDTFGVEGQIAYDSDLTWAQGLAVTQALSNHLRQTVFHWFGDHYPAESKAVLLGLVEWAPNFVMEKLSAPAELRSLVDKTLTTYLGGKVDTWLGIDTTQPPPAVLDQLYAKLTALKASADKYMPLIANHVLGLGRAQEEITAQIAELQTGIMYAINASADELAQQIDSNHAQVSAKFEELGLAVQSVKDLLMTEMLVAADQMGTGLPADAALNDAFLALAQAYADGDADAFLVAYLRWAGLTAERREQMQTEERLRLETERENQLAAQRTLNDFRMVLQLAEMLVPYIKDPAQRRFAKSMLVLMSGALSLAASASALGAPGMIAGVVIIAIGAFMALKEKQETSALNELYQALASLLDDMYTRLDQRIRDAIQLSEYNHAEVMATLRNLQLTSAGIAAAVGTVQESLDFIVRQIDELGQSILQLAYTTTKSRAEIAAGEYNDPSLDVVTEADLHEHVRDWFSLMEAIPPNAAAAQRAPDPQSATYDVAVAAVAANNPPASLLNVIDEDAAKLTGGARLAPSHINPEFLWAMLPDFERYLMYVADGVSLSESTYRPRLVALFRQCQNVIGLRLCVAANANLFRQLFWDLYHLVERYADGVYELFWNQGDTLRQLNAYYRRPENIDRMRTHLGDQVINDWYAQMQFPQFTTQFRFDRHRFSPWTASDRLGLIHHFLSDRRYFPNPAGNPATMAYFSDVPKYDAGDGAVIVYFKDLHTPEQWRIALWGPSELGLDYDSGDGFAAGTVRIDYSAYVPQWSEAQLKDQIVAGIEYADEDVSRITATGKVSLAGVLERSLYKLMQQEDWEYYKRLVGYPFSVHMHPAAAVVAFFERAQSVEQAETDFAAGLKELFVQRFAEIADMIAQSPPSSTTNPAIDFATILRDVSRTITRIKTFAGFAFHNEPYIPALNAFLDRIELTLREFRFGNFDPLQMTAGFASALVPVKRDVERLANVVDLESHRVRQRIMLELRLEEDFGSCGEMMRTIDRICNDHFGQGLQAPEISNAPLTTAVQAVLDAPLIEAVPLTLDPIPDRGPQGRIETWLQLIEMGYRLRNDPRFPKFDDPRLAGKWRGIGEGTLGLLAGGKLGNDDWEKRVGGLYDLFGKGAGLTAKQIDVRLELAGATRAAVLKLQDRIGGPLPSAMRSRELATRSAKARRPAALMRPDDGGGHKEIELKFVVDGTEAFEALAKAAGTTPGRPIEQMNHFFDTADRRLNARKFTIRLRGEADKFILGAKSPESKAAEGAQTIKTEEEVEIDAGTAAKILRGETSPLETLEKRKKGEAKELFAALRRSIGTAKLGHVGSFRNERTPLPVKLAVGARKVTLRFEMDRTSFPNGKVDYEVEVELKGDDRRLAAGAVKAFFQKAGVSWREGPSKAKRFFSAVASLREKAVKQDGSVE
jgi:uncharacterized protein YjbK